MNNETTDSFNPTMINVLDWLVRGKNNRTVQLFKDQPDMFTKYINGKYGGWWE